MPKVPEAYSEARRQQIIDAAYRCFSRKGFHLATMRDIYEEAGLSAGAVYHYFRSKDEIIEASVKYDHERSLPVFADALNDPDPLAALDTLIAFFYAGLESAAEIGANRVNIQGWGEALINPRLLAPLQESFNLYRELLASLIRKAQATGAVPSQVDPEATGEVIISSYLGLYLQKAWNPRLDVGRYQAAMQELLHRSLRAEPPQSSAT